MTRTRAIRTYGPTLAGALRAAAPFIDADKRSHRHRLNLAVHEIPVKDSTERHLFVAAGNASSAILIDAGKIDELEDFATDITPIGAAILVKLFGGKGAGSVSLTLNTDTLRVTSVDRLFDNQSIEVRTRKGAKGTDSVAIMRRVLAYATPGTGDVFSFGALAIGSKDTERLAAVSKLTGSRAVLERFDRNDSQFVLAYIGASVAVVPGYTTGIFVAAELAAQESDAQWLDEDVVTTIQLRHLLNETMPHETPSVADLDNQDDDDADTDDDTDGNDGLVDLDAPALSVVPDQVDAA